MIKAATESGEPDNTAEFLFERINDDVLEAIIARAEYLHQRVDGDVDSIPADWPTNPPPKPRSIRCSAAAFMELATFERGRYVSVDHGVHQRPLYRLHGCGLPLYLDHSLSGHDYRLCERDSAPE